MKQAFIYNELVRFYNRSRRKLHHLVVEGKNLRKQNILQKRIARLFKILTGFQHALKLGMTTAALSAGMLLFQFSPAKAQVIFSPGVINPFGLTGDSSENAPSFVDLDHDGDLDLMSGSGNGDFYYFENIGTANTPSFAAPQRNPFGLTGVEYSSGDEGWDSSPTFADLDNDGDMDMLSGDSEYRFADFFYFENIGSATDPEFAPVQVNPFGLPLYSIYGCTHPVFVDLDNDGDMDIITGEYYGRIVYFENTGTPTAPEFPYHVYYPFGIGSVNGYCSTPAFADLDKDGDLDVIIGNTIYGDFSYYQNTGTPTAPAFSFVQVNPFGLTDVGRSSTPAFADLDNDGDMDLMSGSWQFGVLNQFVYFQNGGCAVPQNLTVNPITANSAKLNWDAVTGADGYLIRYKVQGTDEWFKKTSTINAKKLIDLLPNTAYAWEVKTFCSVDPPGVSSDWSSKQLFTTGSLKLADEPSTTLNVYPNPTSGQFTLAITLSDEVNSPGIVQVINSIGQIIYNERTSVANGMLTKEIQLNDASAGMYLVQVIINDQVYSAPVHYQK